MFTILFNQELYLYPSKKLFILILKTVNHLIKNVQIMVHEFTIIYNKMCIFQTTNLTFAKY